MGEGYSYKHLFSYIVSPLKVLYTAAPPNSLYFPISTLNTTSFAYSELSGILKTCVYTSALC